MKKLSSESRVVTSINSEVRVVGALLSSQLFGWSHWLTILLLVLFAFSTLSIAIDVTKGGKL